MRPQLKKTIGGLGFFCLAFGSMIGVGWITTLDEWLNNAGPVGAMLAFGAGGLLMVLIGGVQALSGPIAGAAIFLSSPAAAWISGAILPVDGGILTQPLDLGGV